MPNAARRVFISYKRNTDPDQPLADHLREKLTAAGHAVFVDRWSIELGEIWNRRITAELEAADFLVLLLSEESVQSSMVVEEVRVAEARFRATGTQPVILPVRIAFEGNLPYDLGAILNRLQYALWKTSADTEALTGQVLRAVGGGAELPAPALSGGEMDPAIPLSAANPRAPLEAPEGTMAAASPFYVRRSADGIVDDELQHAGGYTLTIQAPRQMGKSSMLGRVMRAARENDGKRIVFVDFQAFGHEQLRNPDTLYHQFSYLIEDALDLDPQLDKWWDVPLAPAQKCRRFMEKRILKACDPDGLLLALDEADMLLDAPTANDFFGMLRNWHNERAFKPVWRNFSLAMVVSSEPGMLIQNLSQSPFNVGTTVRPEDFTPAEAQQANALHGAPLDAAGLAKLQDLLGGHPYLTRKALYVLSKARYSASQLFDEAASESGPFGDHLRALLARVSMRPGLADALRDAIKLGAVGGPERHALIAGGVIREQGGRLVARNALYDSYLQRAL